MLFRHVQLIFLFSLFIFLGCFVQSLPANVGTVSIASECIVLSDYNWYLYPSKASTSCTVSPSNTSSPATAAFSNAPGATLETTFTGDKIGFTFSLKGASTLSYMTLRYTIDAGPFFVITLPDSLSPSVDDDDDVDVDVDVDVDNVELARSSRLRKRTFLTDLRSAEPHIYEKFGADNTLQRIQLDNTLYSEYIKMFGTLNNTDYYYMHPSSLTPASPSSPHTLRLWILNGDETIDRWIAPLNFVNITALLVDAQQGTLVLPKPHYKKKLLVFWDSIGEGVGVNGSGHGPLIDNSCLGVWHQTLALALESSLSVVAYGRLGYAIPGNGNVPPLVSLPSSSSLSSSSSSSSSLSLSSSSSSSSSSDNQSWDYVGPNMSRLTLNEDSKELELTPNPEYIVVGHGTNDAMNSLDPASVQAHVIEFLKQIRKASPLSLIFVSIPFGNFYREIISSAAQEYRIDSADNRTFLIDAGEEASLGLTAGGPSAYSSDGVHPKEFRSLTLGVMLYNSIKTVLDKLENRHRR